MSERPCWKEQTSLRPLFFVSGKVALCQLVGG
jgi:hypothetical protein